LGGQAPASQASRAGLQAARASLGTSKGKGPQKIKAAKKVKRVSLEFGTPNPSQPARQTGPDCKQQGPGLASSKAKVERLKRVKRVKQFRFEPGSVLPMAADLVADSFAHLVPPVFWFAHPVPPAPGKRRGRTRVPKHHPDRVGVPPGGDTGFKTRVRRVRARQQHPRPGNYVHTPGLEHPKVMAQNNWRATKKVKRVSLKFGRPSPSHPGIQGRAAGCKGQAGKLQGQRATTNKGRKKSEAGQLGIWEATSQPAGQADRAGLQAGGARF